MIVRPAAAGDLDAWAAMRWRLWPEDATPTSHRLEAEEWLTGEDCCAFVAEIDDALVGFAEAAIRYDYVNGCDTSPVAFGEGAWVEADRRGQGIGRALLAAVEQWARARGCSELASDALLDNTASHAFHRAAGFEETERVVFFRKPLGG